MDLDEPVTPKRSLGALRKARKTKERSPDLLGQLHLQRHTFLSIAKEFEKNNGDEVICNLAAWGNRDTRGEQYLTIEISKYVVQEPQTPRRSSLDFIFRNDVEEQR
jgi:hypothetical protein